MNQADQSNRPDSIRSREVERAEQRDAAGEHEAALGELARGTRAGDVEAMTRLAKRLVIGDRAPLLPQQGAGFLIEATRSGGAEAAARLAVLAAAGACVQQSWTHALELLVVSAQRGWQPAQDQLRVLCRDRSLAQSVTPPGRAAEFWARLAAASDFTSWLTAPPGRTAHAEPLVRVFPSLLPEEVCHWLIAQSRPRLTRARVYDSTHQREIVHETRSNSAATFNLMDAELLQLVMQARMAAACQMPIRNMEALTVLHYEASEQITQHYDFIDPASPDYAAQIAREGQRVITFLIYLNEEYERGETDFPRLGMRHRGQRGEGLYFVNALPGGEPDLRTLHAGLAPANGEKWIISQFIRGGAFLGGASAS